MGIAEMPELHQDECLDSLRILKGSEGYGLGPLGWQIRIPPQKLNSWTQNGPVRITHFLFEIVEIP